jgi:hypothetical protein
MKKNMDLNLKIEGSFDHALSRIRDELSALNRNAIKYSGLFLRNKWREQIRAAGLGRGVEKAVRMDVYPRASKQTLHPSSLVYSNARKIHTAFNDGGTIIAKGNHRYLAIPTDNVPREAFRKRMSPQACEKYFGQKLKFVPNEGRRPGGVFVMDDILRSKNDKGFKPGTKRRLAQGREKQSVIMFVLVRQVTLQKTLDFAGATREAEQILVDMLKKVSL